jgi:cytochrome c
MTASRTLSLITLLALVALPSRAPAADLQHGEQLFRKCVNCHTVAPQGRNIVGPRLYGVFGRVAGSIPDYRYSEALKGSGIVWNDQTLNEYLKDAEAFVPGTKMYGGLSLPNDREDLIAYLKQATSGDAAARAKP